jgi:hypothetical protein
MAGSSATMLTCANHLLSLDLVSLQELGQMVWHNPLRLVGIGPEQIRSKPGLCFDRDRNVIQQKHKSKHS